MNKEEIMINGYQKKRDLKITPMLAIYLVVLFIFSTTNTIHSCSATTSSSAGLTITEKTSEELFVDNEMGQIATGLNNRNSIIQINITVLPQSNSSVEIFCEEAAIENYSPILANFTLAPGESFAETYTLSGRAASSVVYFCWCTLDNSNATIQWWYEVLYSAKPDDAFIGMDFLFIVGAVILSTMTLVFIAKRKSNKKND